MATEEALTIIHIQLPALRFLLLFAVPKTSARLGLLLHTLLEIIRKGEWLSMTTVS